MSASDHESRGPSRPRVVAYALVLTVLSGFCCSFRLSEGTLFGDEAAFAMTTDRMAETGDWVVPYLAELPHLNATPLYNWLTLATARAFDDGPLRHRVWSEAFGVGCVLGAFAVGTTLFRAEVGLLAGLFLTFNRDFLFCHGVRFGGMDAMLAFFVTGAVFSYARVCTRPTRGTHAWALTGVCLGLAAMSKPPAFAGFFLTTILAHNAWRTRRETVAARVYGPIVALAALALVAAPWYVSIWSRLGNVAPYALLVSNSVGRAADPVGRDVLCCHRALVHSSNGFTCTELALAAGAGCWLLGRRRAEWGLLLVLAGSFLVALSAAGKALNYVFCVFPLVAVVVAALFLDAGPRLVARWWPRFGPAAGVVGAALAAGLVVSDAAKVARTLAGPVWVHPPVGVYEHLADDLARGRVRLVLYDFPGPDGCRRAGFERYNFEDLYYVPRMPLAQRVRCVDELNALLATPVPTIVLFPPLNSPQPPMPVARADLRIADATTRIPPYPLYGFHGAADATKAAAFARLSRGLSAR